MSSVAQDVLDGFVRDADDARAWRKKEISELVQALGATEPDSALNETLRRALALLLNAHWEAAVKQVIDLYVVAAKQLGEAESLNEGVAFTALAMERLHTKGERREKARVFGKLKKHEPVLHPLAEVMLKVEYESGRLWPDVPSVVSDRVGLSLWWNRFEYLCGLVDVAVAHEPGDPTMLNTRVIQIRHDIAHGKQSVPDSSELLEARGRVFALMDALVEALQDALIRRGFAR